jgi:hypothetical protein
VALKLSGTLGRFTLLKQLGQLPAALTFYDSNNKNKKKEF